MVGGDRRAALVESAYARIASGGLENLRLRAVAEDVGIDHSTLHHHVKTKQELVLAVAEHAISHFRGTLSIEDEPARALHVHLTSIAALMQTRPELFVVLAELELRGLRDPTVGRALDGLLSRWRARLTAVLERGLAEGDWRGIDPATVTELVVATAKGLRDAPKQATPVLDHLEMLLATKGDTPCTS